MDEQELQKLLRLKRYETPGANYFENFLREFQCRQRAEILKRPLWRIAFDRLEILFAETEVPRFAYAAGAAAIALLVGVMATHNLPPAGNEIAASAGSTVHLAERK